jgi:TfoX/Sxy family transcriptional regulator of competence genes
VILAGMAYDEELAARVRDVLVGEPGITEKRMFGGLAFLVDGHMGVSASSRGGLLVRVAPERGEALLEEPGVAPFEMRGRPMTGWLHVSAAAVEEDDALVRWVGLGLSCARTL